MIRDITAREKAEESLKNAYRIIERSTSVAFCGKTGRDGRFSL